MSFDSASIRTGAKTPKVETALPHLIAVLPLGMVRAPNSETPDNEARRFLRSFDSQMAEIEMRDYIYAWTTRDDEIAEDAITVGIGGTSSEMLMAGLSYVEPSASVYWPARVTKNGVFDAGGEMGPWPVKDALARAHFLRSRMGYERVVVTMAEIGIWRPEYGTLAKREGF